MLFYEKHISHNPRADFRVLLGNHVTALISFVIWLCIALASTYSQSNQYSPPPDSVFIPEWVIKEKEWVIENIKILGLAQHIYILADSTNSLDIQDVIKSPYQSKFVPNYTRETGTDPNITYWGHIILQGNELSFQEYALVLPPFSDEIKLYEKNKDGKIELIAHAGLKVSPFVRKQAYPEYYQMMERAFDEIKIQFDAGERKEWYIKISPSARFDYAATARYYIPKARINRNAIFINLSPFQRMEENRMRFFAVIIFSCIFLTMGLYHLILYGIIKEKMYLYFTFILFFAIFYNYRFYLLYHLIPSHWVLVVAAPIVFCLLYASLIQFSRYFLRIQEVPKLNRWLNYILYFLFAYTLFLLLREVFIEIFDIYTEDIPDFDWRFNMDKFIALFLLTIAIQRYKTGYKMSVIYIMGLGLFTVFANADLIYNLIDTYILGNKNFIKYYLFTISSQMPGVGLCLMLFILAIALSRRYNLNQKEKSQALQQNLNLQIQINQELQAKSQLEELNRMKSRFFANITHEFRTPLTVILGMASQIKGHLQQTQLIHRNGKRLLQLINQLLDLSKLEAGQLRLHLVQQDVIPFLRYLTESFHSLAETKNISLTFYSEADELRMDFDSEKLQQIVSNLLSNAIKYTREGGKVIVHIKSEGAALHLKIQDNGKGISPEKLPYIFDRFYQVDDSPTRQAEGTGIGLALTKELVELMNGEVQVESKVEKGSTFTVMLPITHMAPIQEIATPVASVIQETIPEPISHMPLSEDAPIALIIEDNKDVVTYLQSCLQADYQIEVAYDGEAGIAKALEIVPDIIISDVMMPKKDGYEVCQALKEDERTSHIPIVMLTAKATQEDKLQGLQRGADAYLMKPFDPVELEVRLQKLLDVRKQLKARYQLGEPAHSTAFQQEDEFLQKLRAVVEENMGEETFGVEALAHRMKLSRVQVHRKLKALTDQPTTHFIRAIRMKRAVELLKTTDLQIAEVAYKVGYSDPSYFTRQFVQVYGKRPSEIKGNDDK